MLMAIPRIGGGARIFGERARTPVTIIAAPQSLQTKTGVTASFGTSISLDFSGATFSSPRARVRFSLRTELAINP
jgi:hypothetical protein